MVVQHGLDIPSEGRDFMLINDVIKKASVNISKATYVYDDFNRTDSTVLGTAQTGQAWSYLLGSYGISSNLAIPNSAGAIAVINAGVSDGIVEGLYRYNGYSSLICRVASVNSFINARIGASSLDLFRVVNGATTNLGTYAFTPVAFRNYKITIKLNGSSIQVYLDDVLRISATESMYATNTLFGMYRFSAFTVPDRVDYFKITEL